MPKGYKRLRNIFEKWDFLFANVQMEREFFEFKKNFSKKLMFFFNLIQICLQLIYIYLDLTLETETRTKIFDIFILFILVLGVLCRNKSPMLVIIVNIVIADYYFIFNQLTFSYGIKDLESAYLFGMYNGAVIYSALLSIKLRRIRIVAHIIVIITELVFAPHLYIVVMHVVLFLFYMQEERLERSKFLEIYEFQNNLKNFQSLLDHEFPLSVILLDSHLKKVLYSNQTFNTQFEKIPFTKVFEDMLINESPKELLTPDHQINNLKEVLNTVALAFASQDTGNCYKISSKYRDTNGRELNFDVVASKINWYTKTENTAIAIILSDVSHIVEAHKLADQEKDKVIQTVSHELRTPINGIIGILSSLCEMITDRASLDMIQNCKNCTKLLLSLVNSIIDLTKLKENNLQIIRKPFLLDELIEELNSLFSFFSSQKRLEFRVIRSPDLPRLITSDVHRLVQVLITLIQNALKFTFKGSVTLKVEIAPDDESRIQFSVIDTGIGIKYDDLVRVTELFCGMSSKTRTANANTNGIGIGLTSSYFLIRALNEPLEPDLEVESEHGKGTTFSFTIPFEDIKKKHDDFEDLIENSGSNLVTEREYTDLNLPMHRTPQRNVFVHKISLMNNKYRVLAVDDNPFNLFALVKYLKKNPSIEVVQAYNGQECLEIIDKDSKDNKKFDIIFMDIQMPVMDGITASKILHAKFLSNELAFIPIIALTAHESQEIDNLKNKKGGESIGILEVYNKPINEQQVNLIIRNYVEKTRFFTPGKPLLKSKFSFSQRRSVLPP